MPALALATQPAAGGAVAQVSSPSLQGLPQECKARTLPVEPGRYIAFAARAERHDTRPKRRNPLARTPPTAPLGATRSQETRGRITDLLDEGAAERAVAVLVSAVYFKVGPDPMAVKLCLAQVCAFHPAFVGARRRGPPSLPPPSQHLLCQPAVSPSPPGVLGQRVRRRSHLVDALPSVFGRRSSGRHDEQEVHGGAGVRARVGGGCGCDAASKCL